MEPYIGALIPAAGPGTVRPAAARSSRRRRPPPSVRSWPCGWIGECPRPGPTSRLCLGRLRVGAVLRAARGRRARRRSPSAPHPSRSPPGQRVVRATALRPRPGLEVTPVGAARVAATGRTRRPYHPVGRGRCGLLFNTLFFTEVNSSVPSEELQVVIKSRAGGIAQSEIRRNNLSRMLSELHLRGPLTRSELAASLRINRSTVASLIAELAARGLVWERLHDKPAPQPTPGRPSPVVEICREGPAALSLELSTDWIRAAVIGLGACVAVSVRKDLSLASSTPEQALDEAHDLVGPMLAAARSWAARGCHRGFGAGRRSSPGRLCLPRAQPGLEGRSAGGHDPGAVSPTWGSPCSWATTPIWPRRAEHMRGSGRGTADFICLWGEGGIGAGIVVGGRSLSGAAGYAGEVGHMTVDPDGAECHCGARGCWETEVGEEALLRRSGRDPMGGTRGGRGSARGGG